MREERFQQARIYFNSGRNSVDCLIRDISYEGARIILSDPVSIPDLVKLYIPNKKRTITACVRWRRGDKIGLTFSETGSFR